jgi:Uncharacterized conserved protein
MDRIGVFFKVKPGMQEEYKRRHDNIWPEISEALDIADIHDYTIWNIENMLFSCFSTSDYNRAKELLEKMPRYQEWRNYMEEVVEVDPVSGQKEWDMRLTFFHP